MTLAGAHSSVSHCQYHYHFRRAQCLTFARIQTANLNWSLACCTQFCKWLLGVHKNSQLCSICVVMDARGTDCQSERGCSNGNSIPPFSYACGFSRLRRWEPTAAETPPPTTVQQDTPGHPSTHPSWNQHHHQQQQYMQQPDFARPPHLRC